MSAHPVPSVAVNRQSLRVLVVEDEPSMAQTLAHLLSLWGHVPRVVSEGQAVVQLVEQNWPDVILLDICLPGMDGFEIAKKVRERRPYKPPVLVAVTGLGTTEDRHRSNAVGIDLHLLKPVDPSELQALLDQCSMSSAIKA